MFFLTGKFWLQRGSLDHRTIGNFCPIVGLIGLLIFSAACQTNDTPDNQINLPSGDSQQSESAPVPILAERVTDPDEIQVLWQNSPHADTFVQRDGGKNSDCARCHAPVQWIPTMDDLPESCFTCKFTVEEPPPVIPLEDWTHVACDVCHEVKRGVVSPEYAWLEIAAIGEYSKLDTTSDLCLKCHIGADVPGHRAVELVGVHADLTCTHCHDPHSMQASCGSSGCHVDVFSAEIPGHTEEHSNVSCAVCHDGSGLEIVLNNVGVLETYQSIDRGGQVIDRLVTSHDISAQPLCERCHFPGNPWGLEGSGEY